MSTDQLSEQQERAEQQAVEDQQAVENRQNSTAYQQAEERAMSESEQNSPKKSSSGKGIALLALLVALGLGGAGYYFGNLQLAQLQQQIKQASEVQHQVPAPTVVEMPSFDAEKKQLETLEQDYAKALARIDQLEREQATYTQKINQLAQDFAKLGNTPKADKSAWLLSDADFLLNNAMRKLVLDNDIDTAKNLLTEADNTLSQVANLNVLAVREAIKADLNQLTQVNVVDQNSLMQRLAQLANRVDDLPILESEATMAASSDEVSDSLQDWQQNLEKSASSFLDHFVRISDRSKSEEKAFVAPNQEIYLRENIRLRLQIAILTVPRQQNELYKQSLEVVASWIRSYFNVQNENVKAFLKELDELSEISIYVDAPSRLQSLPLLDQLLNKAPKPVEKIELDAEKTMEQLAAPKATDEEKTVAPAEPASQQAVEKNTESAQ